MLRLFLQLLLTLCAGLAAGAAQMRTVNIPTSLMPPAMAVNVITPDGYPFGTRFPVVYILNGYDGDNTSWTKITQPRLGELADKYGLVMVMPDGRDSWYWDAPANPRSQMESFFITELVPYIDMHYPTIADAAHRAITGLSMGGHGALWLAMRHSDVFGSAGSMSGGVDLRPFKGKWKTASLLGDPARFPDRYADFSVISLVPTLEPGQLNIIFDCGIDDFFAPVNEALHQALVEHKIPHDYTSRPGKHSHAYWANSILYHLLFFTQQFNK